ncbi:MAG: hypothetical protein V2I33_16595, partial [Kangiellaceae bacterium]|nr:hypothetical protein [Kangiellaceae bacterium]
MNQIYAGLFMAYEQSNMEAVLIARALQLFHRTPMPTIGGNLFAHLYIKLRDEDGMYSMQALINYMYDHIDRLTGTAFLKRLKPEDMSDLQYLVFRLQA